jgi:hypothetical protein
LCPEPPRVGMLAPGDAFPMPSQGNAKCQFASESNRHLQATIPLCCASAAVVEALDVGAIDLR